ncbi:MAG: biliverdin-producing heme oxygenase [Phycisphaerales bacterium]|nr:biliverdin-producing heme oxygenase [Phycisphaerales bacterium]
MRPPSLHPPISQPPRPPLTQELKEKTRPQHDEAEHHGLHAVMFGSRGVEAARAAYVGTLQQHLHIQIAFERELRALAQHSPLFASVVQDQHYHLAALRDDLASFDAAEVEPTPGTRRFVQFIEQSARDGGLALLGVFYVFEGSTNGGTIIAMRVRELLGLAPDAGTAFINPHGNQVRPIWMKWKAAVDALPLTDAQRDAATAGAQEAFRLSHAVLSDIELALQASGVSERLPTAAPLATPVLP